MKFPKILIPFLAVVLPSVHFTNNDLPKTRINIKTQDGHDEKITTDESDTQGVILRQFDDSERFLRFAGHSSHRSHSSHSSHKSHSSHQSGNHNSHSSHYSSSSGSADCNGCAFNVEDEEILENTNLEDLVALK